MEKAFRRKERLFMVGKAGNCESMGLRDAFYRRTAEKLQKTAQKAPPDSAGGEAGVVVARRGVTTSGQGRSAGGDGKGYLAKLPG